MKQPKIALVGSRNFPARHGGLEVVVENIANRFSDRQLAVHVFVGEDSREDLVHSIDGGENRVCVHSTRSFRGKYWHTASQILSAMADVRRLKPDLVNIHGVGPAFPLAISKRAFGVSPTLVTAHGLDWERSKWPPLAQWFFRKVAVRALRNATSVSCVSESVGAELSELLGVDVVTTANGFDPLGVPHTADLGLPEKYSVSISRLTPEKNVEAVIDAYTLDVSAVCGPLLIIGSGSGSYSADYENKLRRLAAGRDIVFLGQQTREAALSIVKNASVFISMSKLEARPMALLEAMSLRVPLVLSSIEPHIELCGESARYVHPSDSQGLSQLLLQPDLDAEDRVSSALAVVSAMTWDRSVDSYLSWYESCLTPA